MTPQHFARLLGVLILIFVVVIMATSGTYVVDPGFRGVEVVLGKVTPGFKPEGFGFKAPFVTRVHPISTRQQTANDTAQCYSSDLQQVAMKLKVLFRIPEASVVDVFQGYEGHEGEAVMSSLVAPRVQEALKEVTALQSAEQIVKNRESIKIRALELAKRKIGPLLVLEDIVIEDIALTPELKQAIEQKMVQEQEAAKAKYYQQRVEIEAETVVIKAKGEAESIKLRGEALRENPAFVDLQIVDRWDGIAPAVIGGGTVMMNLTDLEQRGPSTSPTSAATPGQAPSRAGTLAPRRGGRN